MRDLSWLTDEFEHHRPQLRAVAYRMLGSVTEADDALQDAWIRVNRTGSNDIDNVGGWLTTIVGRVCIDMLRSRKARHESLIGTWLPEPVVTIDEGLGPEQATLLAESVGMAMLVVLESLEPDERVAFVLHDMFALPYDEIAPIVGRSSPAARQLASRARRRIRGAATAPDPDLTKQRQVVAAFLAAARAGDFESLLAVLDPDVVFRVDSGPGKQLAPPILTGAADVARQAAATGPRFATLCEPCLVNGAAGIIARTSHGVIAVVGMTVIAARVVEIDLMLDSARLAAVEIQEPTGGPAEETSERRS
ncbi:DNA-directed RNA polymerase sigma-70 factor [Flexivirga endophytica]|uniref:DNA-directed RNA polymerase sigma-70 factor n=2 Tax=Flexivirga endophytica TaxID=1849103 RepID=A0A916TEG9_9MICO|nr:DNA-directed RNA polymerase sigma-70 factor [Flexivirga endophytica]GHB69400.1 DNA-directed RNA polymerase sigma-70 factor [Flexivirga endophytica]